MKKLLAIIVGVVLFCSFALGESRVKFGVSEMTDGELLELQSLISEELSVRKIQASNSYYPGNYIVGADMPKGRYLIYCTGTFGDEDEGAFSIREAETGNSLAMNFLSVGEPHYFNLEDGMSVVFRYGTFSLVEYELPSFND